MKTKEKTHWQVFGTQEESRYQLRRGGFWLKNWEQSGLHATLLIKFMDEPRPYAPPLFSVTCFPLVHLDKVCLLQTIVFSRCCSVQYSNTAFSCLGPTRKNEVRVDVLIPVKSEGNLSFRKELGVSFLCSERCQREIFQRKRKLQKSYTFPLFRTGP